MPFPRFESRPYGTTVSVASLYTGWINFIVDNIFAFKRNAGIITNYVYGFNIPAWRSKIKCKNFNVHVSIPDNQFILHVNIPYSDKMSHSQPFRTVEEAYRYFYDSDDEEPIDICQLPTEESGCLTDEKDIDEDTFQSVLPADV
ncbi:uncharacterized protein TNCV_931111 [Trichonephila clavipes]|uniref:Uncharacterized protein n=1 Tax=Trichonephila clavipes TaxID=2585209 RepID=A0A8X7BCS5_TRICX|nr:uncharacterized protein TNCV_931111 [Trichonephila clavipes]